MNYNTKLTSLGQTQKTFLSTPRNKNNKLATLDQRQITDRNKKFGRNQHDKKSLNILCAFHLGEKITNFCKNKSCLLPLCPKCVKIHSEEHIKMSVYGQFGTIQQSLQETGRQINANFQKISQLQKQLMYKKDDFQAYINAGKQDLRVARQLLLAQINKIFELLQQTWVTKSLEVNKQLLSQIQKSEDIIPYFVELNQQNFKKLNNQQTILQAIITNFSLSQEFSKISETKASLKETTLEQINLYTDHQKYSILQFLENFIVWENHSKEIWSNLQYQEKDDIKKEFIGIIKQNEKPKTGMNIVRSRQNIKFKTEQIEPIEQQIDEKGTQKQIKNKTLKFNLSLQKFKSPLDTFSLEDLRQKNQNKE